MALENPSKKILFVIVTLEIGGAESQLVTLAKACTQRGHVCEVFPLEKKGPFLEILMEHGIVVHDGGYINKVSKILRLLYLIRAFFLLYAVILKTKPDIVHAYLPMANFFGALAGKLAFFPKVITSRRGLGSHQDKFFLFKYIDWMANSLSDRITVNSEGVFKDVVTRDNPNPRKLIKIYNGVDGPLYSQAKTRVESRASLGLKDKQIGIVLLGNLIKYKGHKDVIMALPKIVERIQNFHIFFVGEDRNLETSLRETARNLQVSPYMSFLGRRQDVPFILSGMDICIVASHEEGFCNALLEAMVSGLAVVATDVGGNKEALDHGTLGLIIPSKDPEAIAHALLKLLENKPLRASLSQQAQKYALENFTIDKMVDRTIKVYTEITSP